MFCFFSFFACVIIFCVCQSSQRDDDNVEELTTCKKWRWLETVDLLDSFLNSTNQHVASTFINESAVRILTVVTLTSWSLSRNSHLLLHSLSCFSSIQWSSKWMAAGPCSEGLNKFQPKDATESWDVEEAKFIRLLGDLYQDCYIFSRGFL